MSQCEVFIKYNPYRLETKVELNNKPVPENSQLLIKNGRRLQEWIERLPEILRDECNEEDFHIIFQGTTPDYEDLLEVKALAAQSGINLECDHIRAIETQEKLPVIEQIFRDIQNGPIPELRDPQLTDSFEKAMGSEFHINVVATMSAGKSTLINALLGRKLMPSKQEACTATITEIKDTEIPNFRAKVVYKNDEIIDVPDLTYELMQKFNADPNVAEIHVEGNIPFTSSKETSLVLVDTPGPNNSNDPNHQAATEGEIKKSSNTLILYILNSTQLSTNDDNKLLDYVAASMNVGGKQSKDRFLFVVNKLDDFRPGEDKVETALENVRKYLKRHGIEDAQIFPASALTALDINTTLENIDLRNFDPFEADDNVLEAFQKIRKFNRNSELHLEQYANLRPSLRHEIENTLAKAKLEHDQKQEALIHTGIIPIEAAIRMYVEKYAKTAKIKNVVDQFTKKLESSQALENIKSEIASGTERAKNIQKTIEELNGKLQSGKNARAFERMIDKIDYKSEISRIVDDANKNEFYPRIRAELEKSRGKLEKEQAEYELRKIKSFSDRLQADVEIKLGKVISEHVKKQANNLFEAYKKELDKLAGELKIGEVSLNPFELVSGELGANSDELLQKLTQTERVKTGRHWVENTNKRWYKPWTWFQESGHWTDDYENRTYIDGNELAKKSLAPLQASLIENMNSAKNYAEQQAQLVKEAFKKMFRELDAALEKKLAELRDYANQAKDNAQALEESQEKQRWLEEMNSRVDAILEI